MQRRISAVIAVVFVLAFAGVAWAQQAYHVYLPAVQAVPSPTPLPTPAPPTRPLPSCVCVIGYREIRNTAGDLLVIGEVENKTNTTAYFTKVSARFINSVNAIVDTEYTYAQLTATMPGQRNPFRIVLRHAPADIVQVYVDTSSNAVSEHVYQPAVVSQQHVRDATGAEIYGEVVNHQAKTLQDVQVVVTFYDAQGEVLDSDSAPIDFEIGYMTPGQTVGYHIKTFDPALLDKPFVVQAQGYLAP